MKELEEFHKDKNSKDGRCHTCKSCAGIRAKNHYAENQKEKTRYQREYYVENRDEVLASKKSYYIENKEEIALYKKEHSKLYKDRRNVNEKIRRDSDPIYKLGISLRNRIYKFFKGKNRSKKSLELIGCSIESAKYYIELRFKPGMTWDNYGAWHIDHIYPLSLAKSTKELEKLCHYSNLQPLWARPNIIKSNKIK